MNEEQKKVFENVIEHFHLLDNAIVEFGQYYDAEFRLDISDLLHSISIQKNLFRRSVLYADDRCPDLSHLDLMDTSKNHS